MNIGILILILQSTLQNSSPIDLNIAQNRNWMKDFYQRGSMLDTEVVYTPALRFQRSPVAHFNGENFLVFWTDERSDERDIYCARINQQGIVIDTTGKIVSSAFRYQDFVRACFDGEKYFAVWRDLRNGQQIYGARVTLDGTVIDTSGIMITNQALLGYIDIAFGRRCYLVVWSVGTWPDIYGARIDTSGILIDTNAIIITNAYRNQNYPKVSFDGTNFFVIWQDDRNYPTTCLYGARINEDGILIDTNGIRITNINTSESFPSILYNGENYFIAFSSLENIYGARMTTGGVLIDTNWIPISLAPRKQLLPSIGYSGEEYFIIWADFRNDPNEMLPEVYGARITRDGLNLDSTGILLSRNSVGYFPSVCYDGENFFTVWGLFDIYGVRINSGGVILDSTDILISQSANNQAVPAVAFGGVNGLCAWLDNRRNKNPFSDIYGVRISREGYVIDTSAIIIDTTGSLNYEKTELRMAASDTIYLLVFIDSRNAQTLMDVYGVRVNHRGDVLDSTPILICGTPEFQRRPSVCFGDTHFFVVWTDERPGGIYGARVRQSGEIIDPDGFAITNIGGSWPSVSFDGDNFFVVWISNYQIRGARVTQTGIIIDTIPISITNTIATRWGYPAIAFDGTNYLVVWAERRTDMTYDIYGKRVRRDGVVLDTNSITISVAPDSQVCPAAVFDGQNFFVAWQDFRSKDNDIYGVYINREGIVIDSFLIAGGKGNQSSPVLGARPNAGLVMIFYSNWCEIYGDRRFNSMRIFSEMYGGTGIGKSKRKNSFYPEITIYPNPFVENLHIKVKDNIPVILNSDVFVYDITGRLVRKLRIDKNSFECIWDGRDKEGKMLPSGIYLIIFKIGDWTNTRKVVIIDRER